MRVDRKMAIIAVPVLLLATAAWALESRPATPKEPTQVQWGEVKEGMQLGVQAKTEANPADPIVVTVYVKNVGDEVRRLTETNPEVDFTFTIKDTGGKELPLTRFGKHLMDNAGEITRRVAVEVRPGEVRKHEIRVNRIFDMTLSETYTIVVQTVVPKSGATGPTTLVSESIKVKVLG